MLHVGARLQNASIAFDQSQGHLIIYPKIISLSFSINLQELTNRYIKHENKTIRHNLKT